MKKEIFFTILFILLYIAFYFTIKFIFVAWDCNKDVEIVIRIITLFLASLTTALVADTNKY